MASGSTRVSNIRLSRLWILLVAIFLLSISACAKKSQVWINFGGPSVGRFESDKQGSVIFLTESKHLFRSEIGSPPKKLHSMPRERDRMQMSMEQKQMPHSEDMQVYFTQRSSTSGALDFVIPDLESGTYNLVLLFSENYKGVRKVKSRLFNLTSSGCQSQRLLTNYDIFAEAGSQIRVGVVSEHHDIQVSDHLRLTLTSRAMSPVLNGLVLTKSKVQAPVDASECIRQEGNEQWQHQVREAQAILPPKSKSSKFSFGSNRTSASATTKSSSSSQGLSTFSHAEQTCVDNDHYCTCSGKAQKGKCHNIFNEDTTPNICEMGTCSIVYSCACSGSLMCRKRQLLSEVVVLGDEGLPDGFVFCTRQPRIPVLSAVPILPLG